MQKHIIFGIHITDRLQHASHVQDILTEYGCSIKTRLGLHEASETMCSPNGLMILEIVGDEGRSREMFEKLNSVEGVEAQQMVFDHP